MPKFQKQLPIPTKSIPKLSQIGGYTKSIVMEPHARLKRNIEITTLHKTNKTKMSYNDIILISKQLIIKNPNKKLMIKVLSDKGFFNLKGYDDPLSTILNEEEYINGREEITPTYIYKASFYIL